MHLVRLQHCSHFSLNLLWNSSHPPLTCLQVDIRERMIKKARWWLVLFQISEILICTACQWQWWWLFVKQIACLPLSSMLCPFWTWSWDLNKFMTWTSEKISPYTLHSVCLCYIVPHLQNSRSCNDPDQFGGMNATNEAPKISLWRDSGWRQILKDFQFLKKMICENGKATSVP